MQPIAIAPQGGRGIICPKGYRKYHPDGKVGAREWFNGEEVFTSKGPLGELVLDRTANEWDFPLSISTICRLKKNLQDNFKLIGSALYQLSLSSALETFSLKGAVRPILGNLKDFLQSFLARHKRPFLSGASFHECKFFFGYGHLKMNSFV